MKKRIFTVALSVLAMSLLLGCGAKETEKVDSKEKAENSVIEETLAEKEEDAPEIEEPEEAQEEEPMIAAEENQEETLNEEKTKTTSYIADLDYPSVFSDLTGDYSSEDGNSSCFLGYSTGIEERECKYDFDWATLNGQELKEHYNMKYSEGGCVFTIEGTNYVISFKRNAETDMYDAYIYENGELLVHMIQTYRIDPDMAG